ncbi:MAG: hypothetical protein M1831_005626 [Alyxoria varia]|nr:MAG: hypothetical protein M1831_005626 [Alyxoria varia]
MELVWTEKTRTEEPVVEDNEQLYAKFTFCAYFSPSWEIIRELSFIAISKAAIPILLKQTGLKQPAKLNDLNPQYIPRQATESLAKAMHKSHLPLTAPISRASISSAKMSSILGLPPDPSTSVWASLATGDFGLRSSSIKSQEVVSGPGFQGFINSQDDVSSVLELLVFKHKFGKQQNSELYLKTSHKIDRWKPLPDEPTVWPTARPYLVNSNGTVLVQDRRGGGIESCLFLVEDHAKNVDFLDIVTAPTLISESAFHGPVYETERRQRRSNSEATLNTTLRNRSTHPEVVESWMTAIFRWIQFFRDAIPAEYAYKEALTETTAINEIIGSFKKDSIPFNGKVVQMNSRNPIRRSVRVNSRDHELDKYPETYPFRSTLASFRNERWGRSVNPSNENRQGSNDDADSARPAKRAKLSENLRLIEVAENNLSQILETSSNDHSGESCAEEAAWTIRIAPWDPSRRGFNSTRNVRKPLPESYLEKRRRIPSVQRDAAKVARDARKEELYTKPAEDSDDQSTSGTENRSAKRHSYKISLGYGR